MGWQSLRIEAPGDTAEQLGDALLELGALAVDLEDADAETTAEQSLFAEPGSQAPGLWRNTIVCALLAADAAAEQVLREAESAAGLPSHRFAVAQVDEQDWVRLTQSQFEPIRIRNNLWIVPSWHAAPQPDAVNIVLDPGQAFGSGSHPTTRLCLEWLADHLRPGETVLDYGCGSGILAIAARMLGAGATTGVDIDPLAIEASRSNALQNDVSAHFTPPDVLPGDSRMDIVIANILTGPLLVLAPVLASACRTGGRIALSGILAEQAEAVRAAYSRWFAMLPPEFLDGWALLQGERQ